MPSHSESPYRTGVQCKGFAPAAPRRARYLVSDTVSGLLLSQPVPIIGTVGRYPTVYLIGRSHILWRLSVSDSQQFQLGNRIPDWPQFPEVIRIHRVVWPRVTELSATSTNSYN